MTGCCLKQVNRRGIRGKTGNGRFRPTPWKRDRNLGLLNSAIFCYSLGKGVIIMELQGKTALITGAIRGIGLAMAKELAARGVRCALTYFDWQEDLPRMHQALQEVKAQYVAIEANLLTSDGVNQVVNETVKRFGGLDILINNIERGGWPVVHGPYTPEQWDLEFHTTLTAKWRLYEAFRPYHKAAESACVINISSIAGIVGRSGPASDVFPDCYSAANRAVGSLTETWARDLAPSGRVNEVVLGLFETRHGPFTRGWSLLSEQARQALIDHTLLKRVGRPEEVARLVRFILEEADYMTGASIRLDGGYVLSGERVKEMPNGVVQPHESVFGGRHN
jgi:3-oxoacyl-[acyl-carrier protein] reductase